MLITTGFFQPDRIESYLGVVTSSAVEALSFVKDFLAAISDFTGGKIGSYQGELEKLQQTVISDLTGKAEALGADGLEGLRMEVAVLSPAQKGTVLAVMAYASAVKLRSVESVRRLPQPDRTSPSVRGKEPERTPPPFMEWGKK
ncbi:MAG: heavy metal-binding domain-containing protein [Candidatus Bathyarchaeia archaeon]